MKGRPTTRRHRAGLLAGSIVLAATAQGAADRQAGEAAVDGEVEAILALPGDPAYGAYLGGECVTCHRASGTAPGIPQIAGLPRNHFVRALVEYRSGLRDNEVMRTTAGRLKDDEIAALAAHFAAD